MSTPTVERTSDWDSVPFAGGFAGLRDLADDEFSGMVTAGPARLFMLRGSVIGILDGDIEDFENGGGTAREAPHPALPLLAVMQERSDEVRAQYYTEETPLSEVDRTLADGNFTGFIELSENVLSGDYYQVYHQGRSMSVAYVGASERLIVDDEAFEQADDEVGIYKVRPVDVDVLEIPEPDDAGDDGSAAAAGVTDSSEGADSPGDTAATADESEDEGALDGPGPVSDTTADDSAASPHDGHEDAQRSADEHAGEPETSTAGESAGESTATDGASTATTDSSEDTGRESADGASGTDVTAETSAPTTETPGEEAATETPAATGSATDHGGGESGTRAEPTNAGGPTSAGDDSTPAETAAAESGTSPASPAGSQDPTAGRADASGDANRSPEPTAAGQQGQPSPDHPAAGNRGQERQPGASVDSTPDRSEGSIGAGDLEVRSLPSLDPARTASASRQERERRTAAGAGAETEAASQQPSAAGAGQRQGSQAQAGANAEADAQPRSSAQSPESTGGESVEQQDTGSQDAASQPAGEPATEPQQASDVATGGEENESASADLQEARAEVDRLEAELADLQGEHEAVVEERDRLETELAEAREEIDRLRNRLEDAAGQASGASQKLTPREAIDETNLFIRYDSKGEATLEKAHAGEVDNAAVDENMRLEYHTSFDAADAAVDGIDFDTFLTDTVQYRFVDWLVRKLLYEIRDTGNTGPMAELYDALPKVDRAELNGQIGVQYTENGEEHRAQVGFDVIVRDRMGNPLIVANLNDSRDPATDSMMTDLVRAAERVGESSSSLAGAFLVTRSFFAPEALETAEEATAGGLLNRGKQKSFVNLSRKGGYHLCLVEARNQEFHLAVPEL